MLNLTDEELFNLYKDNVEIKTQTEKIYRPKRYYRRPDLQRLANRWYGMKYTGLVKVDIRARPRKDTIRIPFFPKMVITDPPSEFVKYYVETYKLHVMGYRFTCPEKIFRESLHLALKKFWEDIRKMGAVELMKNADSKETENVR